MSWRRSDRECFNAETRETQRGEKKFVSALLRSCVSERKIEGGGNTQ